MNLFERIQYKLNEEPNKSDSKGQNKKSSRNKKKFSKNISNTVKVSKDIEGLGNRQGRQDATNPKKGGYPRVEDNLDNKPSGKTKLSNTTKGGPVTKTKVVKQSEVSKDAQNFTKKINKKRATVANYPKTREQLVSKRAEYGIDTQGKATKAGIEKFARRRKQSNLPLTKKDISAAKKSMVGTGRKGADVGKYGGKLSKQRYVSDTTFKKIQKKINITNPVKTSPVTGGPIPLKGKELKDYKQQQQQQQQPQQGSSTTTKPKPNNTRNTQNLNQQDLKKKLEQIKKGLRNPTNKSFSDALAKNQTGITTPPPNELEKIKPKVTTSIDTQKKLGKLSQTRLGNPSSLAKTSKHLIKQKNKYLVGAGLALAGGAYLLGKTRLTKAKTKETKAIAAFNQKKAKEPKKMVDVNLFLNKTGTPPTKTSKPKFNSVYDKNYIKNLKPKTTTPKNNPISKYTSGVSNAAKSNAALPYDSSKIASYAKPSQRSSKK